MNVNFFGICLYKYVKSLVKNHFGWNDFHCTIRACVDKIISIGHPGRNNIVARIKYCLDSLTMKRCCRGICVFPTASVTGSLPTSQFSVWHVKLILKGLYPRETTAWAHIPLCWQTGKGQSSLEKQKPEVAGEQYCHTPPLHTDWVLLVHAAIQLFHAWPKWWLD